MPRKKKGLPAETPCLRTFMLADHAEAVNGKMYVTGGSWNQLNPRDLPYTHPHVSVAAAIEVPWIATNETHAFNMQLYDADRNPLLPQRLEGQIEVGRAPGMRAGDYALVVLVFNVNNLKFEKPGSYSFVLTMNDVELGAARFKVQRVTPS
ncbi:MAG: hypothetical protein HYU87_12255 [Chloroflexi bacterium]|nr:hypothetical protein [Chloroflexota bacterium]